MEVIQEEYGTLEKWGKLTDLKSNEISAKALIFGIAEMINEGIDISNEEHKESKPFLTHKQVGRLVTAVGLAESAKQINNAVIQSTMSDEKNL